MRPLRLLWAWLTREKCWEQKDIPDEGETAICMRTKYHGGKHQGPITGRRADLLWWDHPKMDDICFVSWDNPDDFEWKRP